MFEAFDDAEITSTVYPKPWDGHTGGVVGMVVFGTLEMNANINASGRGFFGAEPIDYTGACVTGIDTIYFPYDTPNRSGRMGEGVTSVYDSLFVGSGNNMNGGGGGQGLLAGGAGGGNYGEGGSGGWQPI